MAYKNKEQDHEKRKNQEGSYSVYNYMYRYLMSNYEPKQVDNLPSLALESLENRLVKIGKEYCVKGGNKISDEELREDAKNAVSNFIENNNEHGDTANNLGKAQSSSFENIKRTIQDLKLY